MSLPPPPKRRPGRLPDGPGLTTRSNNKNVHPAEAAGLVPPAAERRTAEQKAEDKAKAAEDKKQAALEHHNKLSRLAAIEDRQRREDMVYHETAHHPIDPPRRSRAPSTPVSAHEELPAESEDEMDLGSHIALYPQANDSDSHDESGLFAPPSDDEDDSDSDPDSEDSGDNGNVKTSALRKQKKLKITRSDIRDLRETEDVVGTPEVEASGGKRKATDDGNAKSKKGKTAKKGGLSIGIKETLKRKSTKEVEDDDSMVHFGGPALDDDAGEVVEREKSIIRIDAPAKKITQKELRGDGSKRWRVSHIPGPASNGDIFTNKVWPHLRKQLGRAFPWDTVSDAQAQVELDRYYGKNVMSAKADVFSALIAYRSHYWRSGFPLQAHKCILEMVQDAAKREEEGTADPDDYKLHTVEGMQSYIEFSLEVDDKTQTKAFYWREWDADAEKYKGLFQSSVVLYTYAHHLNCLDGLPDGIETNEPALGALILASQAVEHELGFWKTGTYIAPSKAQKEQFSFERWGDYEVEATATSPKRRILRATRWVDSLKKWKPEDWEQVNMRAAKYGIRKRSGGSFVGIDKLCKLKQELY
ncbi:hypothetical protein R3P38DRAFT_3334705 [Favolaschia claudopus]|uniref:Uncharacterized protein n=1 Tax=Favolaschia claudopus TaxID=2862362 RepID=A0AAV9ZCC0_9AGAR